MRYIIIYQHFKHVIREVMTLLNMENVTLLPPHHIITLGADIFHQYFIIFYILLHQFNFTLTFLWLYDMTYDMGYRIYGMI